MLIIEPKNNEKRIRPTALSSRDAFSVQLWPIHEFHWQLTLTLKMAMMDASHHNFLLRNIIRIE